MFELRASVVIPVCIIYVCIQTIKWRVLNWRTGSTELLQLTLWRWSMLTAWTETNWFRSVWLLNQSTGRCQPTKFLPFTHSYSVKLKLPVNTEGAVWQLAIHFAQVWLLYGTKGRRTCQKTRRNKQGMISNTCFHHIRWW